MSPQPRSAPVPVASRCGLRSCRSDDPQIYKYNNLRQQQQRQRSLVAPSPAPHCSGQRGCCAWDRQRCLHAALNMCSRNSPRGLAHCFLRAIICGAILLPSAGLKPAQHLHSCFQIPDAGALRELHLKLGKFGDSPKNVQRTQKGLGSFFIILGLNFKSVT